MSRFVWLNIFPREESACWDDTTDSLGPGIRLFLLKQLALGNQHLIAEEQPRFVLDILIR
jgi:hypothetical protein